MSYILIISEQQNHKCCYCGHLMIKHCHIDGVPTPRNALTKDHIEPRTYGGPTEINNLIAACCQCNNLRGEMEAFAFFNLMQKWFKRDCTLRIRWHVIRKEELYTLKIQCYKVHERQLNGLARKHIEFAFRHIVFSYQRRLQLKRA